MAAVHDSKCAYTLPEKEATNDSHSAIAGDNGIAACRSDPSLAMRVSVQVRVRLQTKPHRDANAHRDAKRGQKQTHDA